MKIRPIIALQMDRVMKVGSVVNTGLLVLNLSLLVSQVWKWRGGPTWAWVLGTMLVVGLGIVWFANFWTHKMDMVRNLRRASAIHDPPQVYQLVPWERVVWLNIIIPQIEAQACALTSLGRDDKASELLKQVEKLKRWESLGFVPREDYPKHLLHYYWHEEAAL